MKKILIFAFILISSICCTACINNFAIQELNQIGKEYLDKGDYDNAISRFKAGLDLDENAYETRYNLSIAYIYKENYKDAISNLETVIKLKPDFSDAYYSLALALAEDSALEDENSNEDNLSDDEKEQKQPKKKVFTKEEVTESVEKLLQAVKMFEKYISFESVNLEEKEKVKNQIEELKSKIDEYSKQYDLKTESFANDHSSD